MRYLLTGGAGFIGCHLLEAILKQSPKGTKKEDIVVLDNLSTGRWQNIKHLEKRITFYNFDITSNFSKIRTQIGEFDRVYHLAGLADIVPSIDRPQEYFQANVQGTMNLLEFIREHKTKNARLVYAASSSCYGIAKELPTKESTPLEPQYPYALTKMMGEELICHWAKVYKIPVVSLRLFNVYGPKSRTKGAYGAMFGVFLKQKLEGHPLTVVGDGEQSRDFIHVSDVAQAFLAAGESNLTNEIINIGSGDHYTVNKIVSLLNSEKTFIPKRPGEPDITYADISKAKNLLNWSPKVTLEEGVKNLLEQIDYFEDAPLWTEEKIQEETKSWFDKLS
jgi:UDP-glucose 4-epimerase